MSQATVVISDGSGAAVLSAINAALQAVITQDSGASAPSTTYPYMLWADTANNLLKIRNGANTAWFVIGNLDVKGIGLAPAGAVMYVAQNSAPTGYLKANGAAISRTTYADLFTAIGTVFGVGDGSTTFNVPDLRGEFPRGWDDSRGVDSGRAFGSAQSDAVQGHYHSVNYLNNIAGSTHYNYANTGTVSAPSLNVNGATAFEAAGMITNGSNGTPRVASETRGRNIALLACIKY